MNNKRRLPICTSLRYLFCKSLPAARSPSTLSSRTCLFSSDPRPNERTITSNQTARIQPPKVVAAGRRPASLPTMRLATRHAMCRPSRDREWAGMARCGVEMFRRGPCIFAYFYVLLLTQSAVVIWLLWMHRGISIFGSDFFLLQRTFIPNGFKYKRLLQT